ncbi:MAG: PDZ domain-containing protein [Rikenellaceae bacterium]|nr:PDZ domain-containing protein [Rikenellaceae bacterium]
MKRLILLLLLFPLLSPAQTVRQPEGDDPLMQLQKFTQFYRYLTGSYVDTIQTETLVEDAIKQVLSDLDPHSAYISSQDMEEVKQSFDGNFSGIGIEFNVLNDTIFVVSVIPGGPSEKVGLLPNDRIVEVDDQSVIGTKQTGVPAILRGPKGTTVRIKVIRRGEAEPLDFRIVRDNIPINSVDAAYLINDSTGYIKINRFANNTVKEVNTALDKFGDISALILDLRGNGGGLLDQAVGISNLFLPAGALIVSTEGLRVPEERITAPLEGRFTKGRLIVLTDESTASASEVVAGAVQDWDRGLVIGRRTFGKGLVQRQFPLLDGSAVRITVARYHTPSGRVIQRAYKNGNQEDYYADLVQRFKPDYVDSLLDQDAPQYKTLRTGRTVYGGGGISPDIRVAIDTTGYSVYWSKLIRHGVLNEYVSTYLDHNRPSLARRYPTFEKFRSGFDADDQMIGGLAELGAQRDVPADSAGLATSREEIRLQLKALLAQKLWGMTEYFRIVNEANDPGIREALKALEDWEQAASGLAR